jgi:F-box and WD-40 domain protein CDC4
LKQVLDFGASRDGIPAHRLGKRIVVNRNGEDVNEDDEDIVGPDGSDG